MKKMLLVVIVAGLLAGGCAESQDRCPVAGPCQAPPAVAAVPPATLPPVATAPEAKAADETADSLITLLDGTGSVDTFLVTLETLAALNPKHPKAIVSAIENANRLNLLEGIVTAEAKKKEQEAFTKL